jgi:hypothetical protein
VLIGNQILVPRLPHHSTQQLFANVVIDQPVAVLGEGGGVPNHIIHLQSDEPPKQQVVVKLLHQQPLAADRIEDLQQQRADQPLRRYRGAARMRVHRRQRYIHAFQRRVGQHPHCTQRVFQGYPALQRDVAEHRFLRIFGSAHAVVPSRSRFHIPAHSALGFSASC